MKNKSMSQMNKERKSPQWKLVTFHEDGRQFTTWHREKPDFKLMYKKIGTDMIELQTAYIPELSNRKDGYVDIWFDEEGKLKEEDSKKDDSEKILEGMLFKVVKTVSGSLEESAAASATTGNNDNVDLDDGEYNDDDEEEVDDENVHLREMDRWPGLLSDSLDISEYAQTHHMLTLM